MPESRSPSDDDIDLFELFETCWVGKWHIIVSAVVAALIGFGYHNVSQPVYKVSVAYTTNIFSTMDYQICGNSITCLNTQVEKRIIASYGGDWKHSKTNSRISNITATPLDVSEYKKQFERFNKAFTNKIHAQAVAEVAMIKNEFGNALLNTELGTAGMLNAMRVVKVIDGGLSALTFASLSVKNIKQNVFHLVFLGAFLGGFIGVIVVVVRKARSKRIKQFSGI